MTEPIELKPFIVVYLDGNREVQAINEHDTIEEAEADFAEDLKKGHLLGAAMYRRVARTVARVERDDDV